MKYLYFVLVLIYLTFAKNTLFSQTPIVAVVFTENKGQVGDQFANPRQDVLFGGMANGMAFHLRKNGVSYQLYRADSWIEVETISGVKSKVIDKHTVYRVDVNWLNCNVSSQIMKGAALDGYSNYYSEVCPEGVSNVKAYAELTYKGIYKGIDLKWYQKDGGLKYDFICAAGADYRQIQMEIRGATELRINDRGDLELNTPLGLLLEEAPVVKQNGRILKSKWILKHEVISFEIEKLDKSMPFVIDPAVRVWGTYYGGTGSEVAYMCNTDVNGDLYVTGWSSSNMGTVIATVGSHQSSNGGADDAMLIKFNSNGQRIWGTYYGGLENNQAYSCAIDTNLNVYMSGRTHSLTTGSVVATPGSYQPLHGGGLYDAFLVKFNSNGIRLWGTHYGGAGNDYGYCCALDAAANIYISGSTGSASNIASPGSHQANSGGGIDAFLAKFSSSGIFQWSTYYGGTGSDDCFSCSIDSYGGVYIFGRTNTASSTLIATPASHQATLGGGQDGYLVKFNSAGQRLWGTYYGGTGAEFANSCATDNSGNVFITGFTNSSGGTVIATPGSHQPVFAGGTYDAYLVKFDSSGVRQWSTYYGDVTDDRGIYCSADTSGNIYLTGLTNSTGTLLTTPGSHQTSYGGAPYDAYLAKFNASGARTWATYYGGQSQDLGYSCKAPGNGNVFMCGISDLNTGTVIATAGSHQFSNGGGFDAFIVKFNDCLPAAPGNTTPASNLTVCANTSASLFANGTGTLNWFATPSSTTVLGSGTVFVTQTLSPGIYNFYVEAMTCIPSLTRTVISVTVDICTKLEELVLNPLSLMLYPNPNDGNFVVYTGSLSAKLEILDLLGKILLSQEIKNEDRVEMKNLPPGLYFVGIESAEQRRTFKMIKR